MLRIRFFNVAEGDSILVEDIGDGPTYRLLVDTGRSHVVDLPPCADCATHLTQCGVHSINDVVLTHLHNDHTGGLEDVLKTCKVQSLISGFMPLNAETRAAVNPNDEKIIRGMVSTLNAYTQSVQLARENGVRTRELFASWYNVHLTPRLSADFIIPSVASSRLQRAVFHNLLSGKEVPPQSILRAARLRNPNSMRVRLRYAGREIELSGDCYGSEWENQSLVPCDIWKIPHHGDAKSITKSLVGKLKPTHAVICCTSRYLPRKDRPSAEVIRLLRKGGAQVWFTDAYASGNAPARHVSTTDFLINHDGVIFAPQN